MMLIICLPYILTSSQPTDLVKGSLPFAYLEVSVHATDGTAHEVQIYSDISAEWVSGDSSLQATWSTRTGDIITHQAQLKDQAEYSENNDHTQYGSIYYSTSWVSRLFLGVAVL